MRRRVRRTMKSFAIPEAEIVLHALDRAMAPRILRLDDDHDPRFLHPGRSVLVAMEDGGLRDPGDLAVAAALESVSPELQGRAPEPSAQGEDGGLHRAFEESRALGGWTDPHRAEELLCQRPALQVVALAEWLDQLRHLRHWADDGVQELAGQVTASLYLPLAQRVNSTLARRLEWWHRRVHLASFGGSVDH